MAVSLSARRAWIEMVTVSLYLSCALVALRKESVDRNHAADISASREAVALRKESVDRNPENPMIRIDEIPVALRKESVDRNTFFQVCTVA